MDVIDLKFLVMEVIDDMTKTPGAKRKYVDEESRLLSIDLLKILHPYLSSIQDYRFDGSYPDSYLFLFFVPMIKYESKKRAEPINKLLAFAFQHEATVRIFADNERLCIEVRVPR